MKLDFEVSAKGVPTVRIGDGLKFIFASFALVMLWLYQPIGSTGVLFTLWFFIIRIVTRNSLIQILYCIGVLVAIGVANYWEVFYGSPYYMGRYSDDFQYDVLWSAGYVESYGYSPFHITEHLNRLSPNLGLLHNSKGYVYFVALHYGFASLLDGYSTMLPRISNVALWALCIWLVGRIYENVKHLKLPNKYIVIFFLYPSLIFNVTHVFRDTLVALIILVILQTVTNIQTNRLVKFLSLNICVASLLTLRLQIALVIIVYLVTIYLFINRSGNLRNTFWLPIATLIISIVVLIVGFTNNELVIRTLVGYSELNAQRLGTVGRAVYEAPLILSLPARIAYLILLPAPALAPFYQLFTSLSAYLQLWFLPLLLMALVNKSIDPRLRLAFVILFASIALSTATFRHTIMYLPVAFVLISLQLVKYKKLFTLRYVKNVIISSAAVFFLMILVLLF